MSLINLMGSHGTKAVAAALLGASVTCVDISPVNAAYGAEVAAAAGVQVQFVVADVLHEPPDVPLGEHSGAHLDSVMLHTFQAWPGTTSLHVALVQAQAGHA